MFLSRAVKGTKLKTEAMELLGKLTPPIKVLKSVIHQKQVIADSSGQAATVWDLGGQPASYSGKEYSRPLEEITGALT
jgi:chromosome partitioning protein